MSDPPTTAEAEAEAAAQALEDERRAQERGPISLRVDYKRLNSFFADYTKNISRGGTFIRTDRPLEIGTEFVFELGVPVPDAELGDGKLRLAGVVKWIVKVEEATEEQPAGMGIRFLFPGAEEEEKLGEFVAKLMRRALGDHISEHLLARKPSDG
jgi:type IV pilus assembly protein PilZ